MTKFFVIYFPSTANRVFPGTPAQVQIPRRDTRLDAAKWLSAGLFTSAFSMFVNTLSQFSHETPARQLSHQLAHFEP
jgi:hypothetical protein